MKIHVNSNVGSRSTYTKEFSCRSVSVTKWTEVPLQTYSASMFYEEEWGKWQQDPFGNPRVIAPVLHIHGQRDKETIHRLFLLWPSCSLLMLNKAAVISLEFMGTEHEVLSDIDNESMRKESQAARMVLGTSGGIMWKKLTKNYSKAATSLPVRLLVTT